MGASSDQAETRFCVFEVELISGMVQGSFVYGVVILCLESQKNFCGPEPYIGTASMHTNSQGTCFCTLPLSLSQGDHPRWRDGNRRNRKLHRPYQVGLFPVCVLWLSMLERNFEKSYCLHT